MADKHPIQSFFSFVFRLNALDNSRFVWIDYAKGLAIIMIVFRHVTIGLSLQPGISMDPFFYDAVWQLGLTFRMPLYFMLSGIFFNRSLQKRGVKGYTTHKLETIMYPYLVWYLILMGLQFLFDGYSNADFVSASDFLRFFYDPWGHWWFLYVLFAVSVGYLYLRKLLGGSSSWLLFVGILLNLISYLIGDVYVFDEVLNLFVFFAFGDFISSKATSEHYLIKYSRWVYVVPLILVTIVGEILLFGSFREDFIANLIFPFVGIICASLLCFRLSALRSRGLLILRLLGQHSLYIYLLHPFVNGALRTIFYRFWGIDSIPILIFFGSVTGIFMPIIIYRVLDYFKASFLFYPSFRKKAAHIRNSG